MSPTTPYNALVDALRRSFDMTPDTVSRIVSEAGKSFGDLMADALRSAARPALDSCPNCGEPLFIRTSRRLNASSYRQQLECKAGCEFKPPLVRIVPAATVKSRK